MLTFQLTSTWNSKLKLSNSHKSINPFIQFISNIPDTESNLEIIGNLNFDDINTSELASLHEAIANLPRHITSITFTGNYTSYSEDISQHDEPLPCLVEKLKIEQNFNEFVKRLPNSVHTLIFNFSYGARVNSIYKINITRLIDVVTYLPKNITILNLTGTDLSGDDSLRTTHEDLVKLFQNIPKTVKTLYLTVRNLDKLLAILHALPDSIENLGLYNCLICNSVGEKQDKKRLELFKAIGRSVKKLNLTGNALNNLTSKCAISLFENLPNGLVELDLSYNKLGQHALRTSTIFQSIKAKLVKLKINANELGQLSKDGLSTVFTILPPGLKALELRSNFSGNVQMKSEKLITVLTRIPSTVCELDLSDNDIPLIYNPDNILKKIPHTITKLGLVEKNIAVLPQDLLPNHINTILYSPYYASVPNTVHTLDLNAVGLNDATGERLANFFKGLPSHVRKLILTNNDLAYMDLNKIKQAFKALPLSVEEIDLSENGFDLLPNSKLNERLDFVPYSVKFILDKNKFYTRNNGALMILPSSRNLEFFKPHEVFRKQKEFANAYVTLMSMMHSKRYNVNIPMGVAFNILSYYFKLPMDTSMSRATMERQLNTVLISSKLPDEITSSVQEECLNVAYERIASLAKNYTKLDLSRCGLNRLDTPERFNQIFDNIPNTITTLKLRGNGFQVNVDTLNTFINALKYIPKQIIYLDISDHGFEQYDAQKLKRLLSNLPETVQSVSLTYENPVSPALHIAKRQWPDSYKTLISATPNIMQQARQLLVDYTKGDSLFWLFLFGHWQRNHVYEVADIVERIDKGLITEPIDLFHTLETINLTNESGSLGRRISYILKLLAEPKLEQHQELKDVKIEAIQQEKPNM